jgi:hypothetical protein
MPSGGVEEGTTALGYSGYTAWPLSVAFLVTGTVTLKVSDATLPSTSRKRFCTYCAACALPVVPGTRDSNAESAFTSAFMRARAAESTPRVSGARRAEVAEVLGSCALAGKVLAASAPAKPSAAAARPSAWGMTAVLDRKSVRDRCMEW